MNGKLTQSFPIARGVRQGCPVAPYLFLLIGETLQAMMTAAQFKRQIEGIHFSGTEAQQVILLYANDNTFSLQRDKDSLQALVSIFTHFSLASGLKINWGKSIASFFSQN